RTARAPVSMTAGMRSRRSSSLVIGAQAAGAASWKARNGTTPRRMNLFAKRWGQQVSPPGALSGTHGPGKIGKSMRSLLCIYALAAIGFPAMAQTPDPAPFLAGQTKACQGCDLTRAQMPGADLSRADLAEASLKLGNFADANFAGADLHGIS